MNCDILKIVRGNDFATQMTITALDAGGNVIEDFSLEDSTDVVVKYTLAGESHTIEAYDYDIEGNDITIQWSDLALGKYGFEIEGKFNGYSWRSAARFIFQIVADNASANIPDGVLVNGIYILNDWLRLLSGTGGGIKQVQADWTETDTEAPSYIQHKPELAPVATSGSYNDLTNKPTIPDVTGKADKVSGAVAGDFAALDENGNLTDSGKKTSDFQATLVSGTNIKTINNQSLLGSGNIDIQGGGGGAVESVNGKTGVVVLNATDVGAYELPENGIPATDLASSVQTSLGKADNAAPQSTTYTKAEVDAALNDKQNTLISGTNIATINGSDITQGGNVTIVAAEGQTITIDATPTKGSNNAVSSGGAYNVVDKLNAEVSGLTSYVDLSTFTEKSRNINASNKWENGIPSILIPVNAGDTYIFTRKTNAGFIAFLKSDNNYNSSTVNQTVDFCDGYGSRFTPVSSSNPIACIKIPNDCNYIYVCMKSGGNRVDTTICKGGIVYDKLDELDRNVSSLDNTINNTFQESIDYLSLPTKSVIINSNNVWENSAQVISTCIQVNPNEKYNFHRVSNAGYIALLKSITNYSTERTANTVDFCDGYSGRFLVVDSTNPSAELVIPSDCHYIYMALIDGGSPIDTTLSKGLPFQDGIGHIEEKINEGAGITHLLPDTQGQLNVVKRMRQITDIEWTPAFDIPRLSWGAGGYFQDKFKAGVKYRGIPYARGQRKQSDYGYNTFKVGIYVPFETFMTAISNKGTIMETESVFNLGNHDASFFATVCSAAVSYALGLDYVTSAQFPSRTDMTNVGKINNNGTLFDLSTLKLGDVLSDPTVHTAMVTDVIIENGVVKFVEVSESTPDGNENNAVLGTSLEGGQFGGTTQRLWWTPNDFYDFWGNYNVLRYKNIASVTYTPCPYVPMPNEDYGHTPYMMACLPYMGNGFKFLNGKIPETTILINATGFTKLRVLKDGLAWNTDGTTNYYDVTSLQSIDVGFSENGEYEAYLCNVSGTTETNKTKSCRWSVVSSITPAS